MKANRMIRGGLVFAAVVSLSVAVPLRAAGREGGGGAADTRPAGGAPAEGAPAAAEPARDETPVQALMRGWRVCDQCDVGKAMELYEYGPRERALTESMCTAAAAGTRVELAMRRRFGEAAAADMVHAIGQSVEADLLKAQVAVDGDTATVFMPNTGRSFTMVRVGGVWKDSVKDQTAGMADAQIEASVAMHLAEAAAFRKVAARLEAGELKTAEEVSEAMVRAARPAPPPPGGGPV